MKITTYNQNGEKIGETELPEQIFGVKIIPELLHQAVVAQFANMRKVIAHTKDRSEVRGGGKKPWRQKGTGRARHGSRRSPLWVGGGVTFGPTKERNFKKGINKKMKQNAILMAMSGKFTSEKLVVLDKLELKEAKTKEMAVVLDKLIPGGESALMLMPGKNEATQRASRNIPGFKLINSSNINIRDLLSYNYLMITKETIEVLKDKYSAKREGQNSEVDTK